MKLSDDITHNLYQRLRQFARVGIGRLFGTISDKDSRYKWGIELAESRLFHRAELNALITILVEKKVFTQEEWSKAIHDELLLALGDLHREWPEIEVMPSGQGYTINLPALAARMKREGWPQ